ncbi:hypothetical protein NDI54_10555 [Haloarcula sp. S1AR25-5A]|uniref:DUF7999 domain-containing protein n=1 Tax=Haloarcula terrestris TaxID=2950533 RepID=A0AAE4EX48_9EURY|nr:hypothetical protein [Haloarcula terrestris]MDS0221786.1 hypothetical protein [Haloarcula terrestris]
MSKAVQQNSANSYIVEEDTPSDVELTLRDVNTGRCYDIVDYADPILAEKLQARGPGSTVRVELAPVDTDGDRWAVTRHLPGAPPRIGLGR